MFKLVFPTLPSEICKLPISDHMVVGITRNTKDSDSKVQFGCYLKVCTCEGLLINEYTTDIAKSYDQQKDLWVKVYQSCQEEITQRLLVTYTQQPVSEHNVPKQYIRDSQGAQGAVNLDMIKNVKKKQGVCELYNDFFRFFRDDSRADFVAPKDSEQLNEEYSELLVYMTPYYQLKYHPLIKVTRETLNEKTGDLMVEMSLFDHDFIKFFEKDESGDWIIIKDN